MRAPERQGVARRRPRPEGANLRAFVVVSAIVHAVLLWWMPVWRGEGLGWSRPSADLVRPVTIVPIPASPAPRPAARSVVAAPPASQAVQVTRSAGRQGGGQQQGASRPRASTTASKPAAPARPSQAASRAVVTSRGPASQPRAAGPSGARPSPSPSPAAGATSAATAQGGQAGRASTRTAVLTSPNSPVAVPVPAVPGPARSEPASAGEPARPEGSRAGPGRPSGGAVEAAERQEVSGSARAAGGVEDEGEAAPPSGSSMVLGFGEPPFPKNATQAQLRSVVTVPVKVQVRPTGETDSASLVTPSGHPALDAFALNFARRGIRYRPYGCSYSVTVRISFDPADGGKVLVARPDEDERIAACPGKRD